ncbi:MAG: hypothetical protein KGR98_10480 [Verrucomicrobia bacterium]|nr:hypothetical protein [Verrucomicrobiota bacterium]
MKRCKAPRAILLAACLAACSGLPDALRAPAQVEYVDPSIGSVAQLLEPTRPTVSLPNSMVRVYPVRRDGLDDQIHSFPLTIISHRLGELFWLMPCAGAPDAGAWDRPAACDQERETPYYYSTRLDGSWIRIELTPTTHCGFFRFTFPSGKPVVLLANRIGGEMTPEGTDSFSGWERFHGMKAFVYGRFNAPVDFNRSEASGKARLAVSSRARQNEFELRYGISFISIEQARKNLIEEIPDWNFDRVKQRARDRAGTGSSAKFRWKAARRRNGACFTRRCIVVTSAWWTFRRTAVTTAPSTTRCIRTRGRSTWTTGFGTRIARSNRCRRC